MVFTQDIIIQTEVMIHYTKDYFINIETNGFWIIDETILPYNYDNIVIMLNIQTKLQFLINIIDLHGTTNEENYNNK